MAERYNRAAYGKQDNTTIVGVSIGDDFLAGLKEVEAQAKAEQSALKEIEEADYEMVSDKNE